MSHANNRFALKEGIVNWNKLKLQGLNTKIEDWLKDLPAKFEALGVEMKNIYKKPLSFNWKRMRYESARAT